MDRFGNDKRGGETQTCTCTRLRETGKTGGRTEIEAEVDYHVLRFGLGLLKWNALLSLACTCVQWPVHKSRGLELTESVEELFH